MTPILTRMATALATEKLMQQAQTEAAKKTKTVPIIGEPEGLPDMTKVEAEKLNISIFDGSNVAVMAREHTAKCAEVATVCVHAFMRVLARLRRRHAGLAATSVEACELKLPAAF